MVCWHNDDDNMMVSRKNKEDTGMCRFLQWLCKTYVCMQQQARQDRQDTDVDLLLATLCTRSIPTREGNIIKALDCNAAVAGRDTLAKTVYARLFDWLVDKINRSVGQDINSQMQIGVLDIYHVNSLSSFCTKPDMNGVKLLQSRM
ncbi:hypothetical protein KIW84_063749 [Lathyrus oleraceus]|uniref:Myosin motor domain-containing protein n=1 Tax=Pisum sativum TaxID=3888 RepID=A0A9D5A846_PEA|nr:hypothetical protein KIW84_063749 [Pisum sativum]